MMENKLRSRITEIDAKLDLLKEKLEEGHYDILSEHFPQDLVKKVEYEDITPNGLKTKKGMTLEEIVDNLIKSAEQLEEVQRLEEGQSSLEFYNILDKTKGAHPNVFNEPEFVEIREKFDQLPQNKREQLAGEMAKIGEIARGENFSPLVLEASIEKTLKEIKKPTEKRKPAKAIHPSLIHIELRKEWLSEGIITKRFLDKLQARHPEADIGIELMDFYVKKKLSEHMIEGIPTPKIPEQIRKKKPKKKKRKARKNTKKKREKK